MRLIPISVSVTATGSRGFLAGTGALLGDLRIAVAGGASMVLATVAAVLGAGCR